LFPAINYVFDMTMTINFPLPCCEWPISCYVCF